MKTSEYPHIIHLYTYEPHSLHIIAPLKCGTRYLRSLGLPQYSIYANDTEWYRAYETNWKFIILRNPLELIADQCISPFIQFLWQDNIICEFTKVLIHVTTRYIVI